MNSRSSFLPLVPSFISALRLVMVPYVFVVPPSQRILIVILAVLSDFLDGFLARRWKVISTVGVLLDPLGDKALAVAFAYAYWSEGVLGGWDIGCIFARDIALFVFGAFLVATGTLSLSRIRAFLSGKAATICQALLFGLLSLEISPPQLLFVGLAGLGVLSLGELLIRWYRKEPSRTESVARLG